MTKPFFSYKLHVGPYNYTGAWMELAPFARPSRGGKKAWYIRTVCICVLISRHSGNSVLRMDNFVFKRHDLILSGLLLGSLREREHSQYNIQVQRSVRILYPVPSLLVSGTQVSQHHCECSVPD